MNALDHLRKASDLIARGRSADRSTLSEAAGHFWSASFDEEHWPLPLRVASTSLKAKLLAEGAIGATISSLDDEHVGIIADELSQFCGEARVELAAIDATVDRNHPSPMPQSKPRVNGGTISSAP